MAFNQELCAWGVHYDSSKDYTNMFYNSQSCTISGTPQSSLGPWCSCMNTESPTSSPTGSRRLGETQISTTLQSADPSLVAAIDKAAASTARKLNALPTVSMTQSPTGLPGTALILAERSSVAALDEELTTRKLNTSPVSGWLNFLCTH